MVIFSRTLLSSFSLSEIYSFLKYLHYRQRQAVVTVKIYNPGLDCLGATHFLTLCDPCWGRDPYFGNPWTSEYYFNGFWCFYDTNDRHASAKRNSFRIA